MKLKFTLTLTVEGGTVDSDNLGQNILDAVYRCKDAGCLTDECDGYVTDAEIKYEGVSK